MRISAITLTPCFLLVACSSTPATDGPSFASVRERLTAEPTRLFIDSSPGIGTLEARRWSSTDGWIDGIAPVALNNGELIARIDAAGKLVVQQFDFKVDAIDLPGTLIGSPLQLRDVRVTIASASPAAIVWTSENEGTAQVSIELTLSWSLSLNGNLTPLGAQKLAPMPMDIAIAGGGDHVDATLGLHAQGTLWSWAELLELTKVDLTIAAATVD
jgi:hypothetical protein